jgi:hypothetical protein
MRPRTKLTVKVEARLDEVARMKSLIPTYRELEIETGLSQIYLRELVSEKIQALTNQSRETAGA